MMRNIFEGAEQVLVWLGEANADSSLAVRLVNESGRASLLSAHGAG
jgi:hypothetical protein